MTVRCPNCQKKQEEPCPKRCGCGRSLLAVLAALRDTARVVPAAPLKPGRRALERPLALAAMSKRTLQSATAPVGSDDNEW
jgi:hypothetical protein